MTCHDFCDDTQIYSLQIKIISKQVMTFVKQLQPRAEMLTNNAYASLWTVSGALCPSICRTLCDWLAVTKVVKEPVFYKYLTVKRSSLITEQELYKIYLRILDSKANGMTRYELL